MRCSLYLILKINLRIGKMLEYIYFLNSKFKPEEDFFQIFSHFSVFCYLFKKTTLK
jgi:hypothetical protein